jgi:hypothetical protein
MPRVVHGVNKIVKGVLNASPHMVMHGAFGIAPEDIAEDLIGTYNSIFGIPDPDDLPAHIRKKTTAKPTPKSNVNSTAKTESPIKSKVDSLDKDKDDDDDDDDDDDFDEERK